ncbi:MAG: GNAT family N-acetyltransferase [Rhodobiaceae bacterium]|nr:GNAT family N-acetyltransferase [Rhodobiaceae bacterium]
MTQAAAEDIRTERVAWRSLAEVEDAWRALSRDAATPNIFNGPEFAEAAARALGADEALQAMLAWREDGDGRELVGLMPFRRRNRWGIGFPVVEAWAHPYAPACLPLVRKDCAEAATIALFDAITADPALPGIVMLPLLSLDTPFAAALLSVRKPLYVHAGHQRAVARSANDGDAYLAQTLSGSRRKRLRQQLNALAKEGEISFSMVRDARDVNAALGVFLQLEASGWKGQAGSALKSDPASRDLADAAVSALARRGQVRILILHVDTRPVAGLVAFVADGTAWLWKIAYDENFARHSPGKHVMMEMVRQLLNEEPGLFIDSCATPGHPLADLLLGERMAMGDVVVSAGGRAGPAFRTANLLERLRGQARVLRDRIRG